MKIVKRRLYLNQYKTSNVLRVAAYCRVSTLHQNQVQSIEKQIIHYENEINKNPMWKFAGVFADKSSGRNRSRRNQFQQMIVECYSGNIDLIITKSISRFGRNTLELLELLNELKSLGVDVYFENERMYLLKEHSDLMLTIYAALYQNESEEKSFNIKWGIKRSFENIDSKYQNRICYGYSYGLDGRLIINPTESAIVKKIFNLYLSGYSLRQLSYELKVSGVKSPRGFGTWSIETINKILSNEKYTGNVMLQKTIVENYFDGKQITNKGQADRFYISNSNPVIISQEQFNHVQLEKKGRKTRGNIT